LLCFYVSVDYAAKHNTTDLLLTQHYIALTHEALIND